jgi:hypothetical protein
MRCGLTLPAALSILRRMLRDKALDLAVPQTLFARADEVIE